MKGCDLFDQLDTEKFTQMLGYLADIFEHMNRLSISLQGKGVNIFEAREKLNAFKEKLSLWHRRVEVGNFSNFPLL